MRYQLSSADVHRFWSKVKTGPGCWAWKGSTFKQDRRPAFWLSSVQNNVLAYRVAYNLSIGEIPDDLLLDHRCNNASCVNPFHLEPSTQRANVLRSSIAVCAKNARKAFCKRGHPLVPWSKSGKHIGKGWRKCHICAMESQRRRRAERHRNSHKGHLN